MPRISEFYGIVIYMYFQDHNPPHFHAIYAEHEALIRIDTGEVIGGRLPKTAGSLVEESASRRRSHRQLGACTRTRCAVEHRAAPVAWTPMDAARVTDVEHLGGRVLRLVFADGLVRELDFADALPGILATIDDDDAFPTVTVDPVARTISWPAGVDFDPDVLHGDQVPASGTGPRLVREYHGEPAR